MIPYYFQIKYSDIVINGGFILDRVLLSICPKMLYTFRFDYDMNLLVVYAALMLLVNVFNYLFMKHMKYKEYIEKQLLSHKEQVSLSSSENRHGSMYDQHL